MLTKINRQTCLIDYPKFPYRDYDEIKDEEIVWYPQVFASYKLGLLTKSFRGHVTALANELTQLMQGMEFDTVIFLGDSITSWLFQESDYKPAKEAIDYLVRNKVGKKFNGALQAGINDLPLFIKQLAWLVRCNASLPFIHFCDKDQNFMATICQYGNLHFNTLNELADIIFKKSVTACKFEYLNGECYNRFGKTGATSGRRIII